MEPNAIFTIIYVDLNYTYMKQFSSEVCSQKNNISD